MSILRRLAVLLTLSTTLAGCATARTVCPSGTGLARRVYSGGGEAEWCRRSDGVRQGPETRFYESGVELSTGDYLDGAVNGVWRYHFNDGRNWRADRWDDGALVQQTIDPTVAAMSPAEMEALGPTSSGIIKLASRDPLLGRDARDRAGATHVVLDPGGRARAAGSYDADGLRTGVWRFWYPDGRPEREVEYLAGVRERTARAWHPNGMPATDGFYLAGEREGRWRWWDPSGRYLGEARYQGGKKLAIRGPEGGSTPEGGSRDGGMLAP